MTPALYREGLRVQLVAIEGEDINVPQEVGKILSYTWSGSFDDGCYMYVVEVEDEYLEGLGDDGLRELSEDQIEKVLDHDG